MRMPEPDAGWVERLRRRDPAAAAGFVDGFGPGLVAFLRRMSGSRTAAEDLFQETCLRVVEALPRYEHRGRFRAWVFSIAANVARDHLRRRRHEARAVGAAAANAPPAAPGADRSAAARESIARMEAALARLTPEQREVFLLRTQSDLTFREIAEATGSPLNTVLGRMHDAVERLRKSIDDETTNGE